MFVIISCVSVHESQCAPPLIVLLPSVDLESTGAMPPESLMPAAIQVLLEKVRSIRKSVERLEGQSGYTASSPSR